ncbi:MAG: hypothetical protein V7641_4227 [Blastocatellia bacterium]
MDIVKLTIENFLAITRADILLNSKGLVLVQGENKDDPSASSNGAGKSSIADALFWGLYGETARGASGDAVVNRSVNKNCRVIVYLQDSDRTFEIRRHRKHKDGRNSLQAFSYSREAGDDDPKQKIELTKGTEKDTQELLQRIIGCSVNVFRAAVYSGQEALPNLPGMTDKQLKLLVEESAGIDLLQQAYTEARDRSNGVKGLLAQITAKLTGAMDLAKATESAIDDAKRRAEDWEADHKAKLERLKTGASEVEIKVQAEEKRLAAFNEKKILEEIVRLDEILANYNKLEKERDRHAAVVRQKEKAAEKVKGEYEHALKDLKHTKGHLDQINSKIGMPCGECGKLYQSEDIEHVTQIAKKKIKGLTQDVNELKRKFDDASRGVKESAKDLDEFRASMPDVSKAGAEQRGLRGKQLEVKNIRTEIQRMKDDIRNKLEQAKNFKKEANPYKKSIEDTKKRFVEAEKVVTQLRKDLAKVQVSVDLHEDAVSVFGPAGVRAHILDTVTPFLNERTAHYLGALSDGNISATWATLSKTAKGEIREKFIIEVTSLTGAEEFTGLSGGEKRKVRLSCALALQDLISSRAAKPISLWIGDEIDDALDVSGLERLMNILEDKARERGTVLVISHNSLSDWINEQIIVTREEGLSFVTGALSLT